MGVRGEGEYFTPPTSSQMVGWGGVDTPLLMLPSRANVMIGGAPAEKETVGRVVGRVWRVKVG